MNIRRKDIKEADKYKTINKCLNSVKKYDYSLLVNVKDGERFYIFDGYRCFICMDTLCTRKYVVDLLLSKDIVKLTMENYDEKLEDKEYIFT